MGFFSRKGKGSMREAGELLGGMSKIAAETDKKLQEMERLLEVQERTTKLEAIRLEREKKELQQKNEEKERVVSEKRKAEQEAWDLEREEEFIRRKGDIMQRTEMSAAKLEFPTDKMGLVDRLEAHRAGTFLKNVVISNQPPPDRELNLARLRTFKPANDVAKMTLSDIRPIELKQDYETIELSQAMTSAQFEQLKDYCLISDVFVHYQPLDSFYSRSSPVHFILNDFRKIEETQVRSYTLSHSAGYNILFSLDYCVKKNDLDKMALTISTSLNTFRKGITWGACKVIVSLIHMDFPIRANMQDVMGVTHLSDSDLKEFLSDPRGADGVITPEALKLMRQHYGRGDIENVLLPKDDRKEINTARTVIDPTDTSLSISDMMKDMREKALEKQREEQAPLKQWRGHHQAGKSSMKKSPLQRAREELEIEEAELDPGDSFSNAGEDETISLPRQTDEQVSNMRSVNFS